MSHHNEHSAPATMAGQLMKATGVHAQKCYQCGKCTAGCPVASEMDLPPSMVLRMLQTEDPGNDEQLLKSYSVWLCVTCELCLSRCPMEIDIPSMMDWLRHRSIEENKVNPKAKRIIAFHRSFLNSIKYTGRLFEFGLIIDYKRRSMNLLQDVMLAPKMISKGKLHFIPDSIRDKAHIKSIFRKTLNKE